MTRLPRRIASRTAPPCAGFTLLEVLLAVAIFAIVAASLLGTFQIATRAFELGQNSSEIMQTMRFTVDRVTRDLRGVRYETDYNRRFEMLEIEFYRQEDQLLSDLEAGLEATVGGVPTGIDVEDPEDADVGREIDMRFLAEGDGSEVVFTHRLPDEERADDRTWHGLERVRYFLRDGALYRQRSKPLQRVRLRENLVGEITRARESLEASGMSETERRRIELFRSRPGELPEGFYDPYRVDYLERLPFEDRPPPELLARDVVEFKLRFGFFEEDWREAASWDSDAKRWRTPEFEVPSDNPEYENKLIAWQQRATDGLPSYVRLILKIKPDSESEDPKSDRRTRSIETVVWIPSAQETFSPVLEEYFAPPPPEEGQP